MSSKVRHYLYLLLLYRFDLQNHRNLTVLGTFIRFSNDNIHNFMRGQDARILTGRVYIFRGVFVQSYDPFHRRCLSEDQNV